MLLRALLLGSVTCLLGVPGAALAAGQTPSGAGYSDANIPAPAAGLSPSGASHSAANALAPAAGLSPSGASHSAANALAPAAGLSPSGASHSAANALAPAAGLSPSGASHSAAIGPALATGLPARACATAAGALASAPTAAGDGSAGVAPVLDARCTVPATRCPQGTTPLEPEPILAGTTGPSGYDAQISARLLDRVANNETPQAPTVQATAGNGPPAGSSNMVQLPELGTYGTTGDLVGCVCAVSSTTGAAETPTEDAESGGVVIRIPMSAAEIGLSLLLLAATVAGLSLLVVSRRRRRARTPPW